MTNQDQFYERLSAEYDTFIDQLKTKTPDEILIAAYEKVCKEEIVIIFENNEFSEGGYAALLQIENPLDTFYKEWLDTDSVDMEAIRDCIKSTVKRETGFELSAGYDEHYEATEWRDRADCEEPEEHGDYSLEERIAAGITAKSEPTAQVINGAVNYGDWVIVRPDDQYSCLVGQVTAIDKLGSDEHNTDNPGDDIHVNFVALEYSEITKAELHEALDGIYPNAATFNDIPLGDVIMASERLISLTGLDFDHIGELSVSYNAAREFGNKVLTENFDGLEQQLIAHIEQNYEDYNLSLLSLSKQDIIEKAAQIHATSDAWSYMTSYHAYTDEELLFYSQFANPLEVVADAWHKQKIDLEDMSAAMDFVYEQRGIHLSVYPLKNDIPAEPTKESAEIPKETRVPGKEKSTFERSLERGKAKAEADKAHKASEPSKNPKNKEVIE